MDTGTIIITEDDVPERAQKVVIYTRVSAAENRPNLDTQAERLSSYCAAKGYQVHKIAKEIGRASMTIATSCSSCWPIPL